MALVCHDQYDHPLLWCDERRRAEERRIASEGLAIVEQQKKSAELRKHRERNEVSAYPLSLISRYAMRCHKNCVTHTELSEKSN